MKKSAVIIIAFNGFRDEEYLEPKAVLEKAGIKVVTASAQLGIATGKLGAKVKVDTTIDKINVKDYTAVIFVGGPGSYDYFENKTCHSVAQEAYSTGKILASICAATAIPAHAGLVKGRKVTSFSGVADIIKSSGGNYTGAGVEVDGNLITADGPQSAKKFGEEIVKALESN